VAVAHNDGTVTIRAGIEDLDNILAVAREPKEWIEAMRYSPNGRFLAVGSHDNFIYIYSAETFRLIHKVGLHSSYITELDWS
jgi:WD40 repeat protein